MYFALVCEGWTKRVEKTQAHTQIATMNESDAERTRCASYLARWRWTKLWKMAEERKNATRGSVTIMLLSISNNLTNILIIFALYPIHLLFTFRFVSHCSADTYLLIVAFNYDTFALYCFTLPEQWLDNLQPQRRHQQHQHRHHHHQ